jgi:hypothetical protein
MPTSASTTALADPPPRNHRGDQVAEAILTGTWMAHLLLCCPELLHNLLIDTARRPQHLNGPD